MSGKSPLTTGANERASPRSVDVLKTIIPWLLLLSLCLHSRSASLDPYPEDPHEFLFVLDASSGMKRFAPSARTAIAGLIANGAQGRMRRGDVFALWLFQDNVITNAFKTERWLSEISLAQAGTLARSLEPLKFSGKSNQDGAVAAFMDRIKQGRPMTVFLISSGSEVLFGTPFDLPVSTIYVEHAKEMSAQKRPFVTTLVARKGEIKAWSVDAAGAPIRIPELPDDKPESQEKPPVRPKAEIPSRKPAPSVALVTTPAPTKLGAPAPTPVSPKPEPVVPKPVVPAPEIKPKPVESPKLPAATVPLEKPGPPKPKVTAPEPRPTNEPPVKVAAQPAPVPAATKVPPPPSKPKIETIPKVVEAPTNRTVVIPKLSAGPSTNMASLTKPITAPALQEGLQFTASPVLVDTPKSHTSPPPVTVVSNPVPPKVDSPVSNAVVAAPQPVAPPKPPPAPVAALAPKQESLAATYLAFGVALLAAAGFMGYMILRRQGSPAGASLISESFDREQQADTAPRRQRRTNQP